LRHFRAFKLTSISPRFSLPVRRAWTDPRDIRFASERPPSLETAQSQQIFPANIYHCIGGQLMHNTNILPAESSVLPFQICAAQNADSGP
jgi:hypothetical protein